MTFRIEFDVAPDVLAALDRLSGAVEALTAQLRHNAGAAAWNDFGARHGATLEPPGAPPAISEAWSADRIAVLEQDYPNIEATNESVLATLNRLPGTVLTLKAMLMKAQKLGIRQARGAASAEAADRPAPIARVEMRPATVFSQMKFSEQQKQLLTRDWSAGRAAAEILPEINALPGRLFSPASLSVQAAYWKIKRPPGHRAKVAAEKARARRQAAPPPTPAVKPPAPLQAVQPVQREPAAEPAAAPPWHLPAGWNEISAWAAKVGIKFDGANLSLINQRRRRAGKPIFALVKGRLGAMA